MARKKVIKENNASVPVFTITKQELSLLKKVIFTPTEEFKKQQLRRICNLLEKEDNFINNLIALLTD